MTRTIVRRSGLGSVAHIVQRSSQLYGGLVLEKPTVVFVRRGKKWFRGSGKEFTAEAGQVIAIAEGCAFDIINHPAADGAYEADCIYCNPEVVAEFTASRTNKGFISGANLIANPDPPFFEAFDRAMEAIAHRDPLPCNVAVQRIREMLAWLRHFGAVFAIPKATSTSNRVRALFSADPQEDWIAPDVSHRLGMSEATLRRRLAAEGQSLTRLLIDIRMCSALSLLQSTDRPVAQIAYEVGYESASRFAARFRQRFGHPPTEVREERALLDRIGTAIDRP
jgi:AraC-like DNA-binding protein